MTFRIRSSFSIECMQLWWRNGCIQFGRGGGCGVAVSLPCCAYVPQNLHEQVLCLNWAPPTLKNSMIALEDVDLA